jgi:hypothetical protein
MGLYEWREMAQINLNNIPEEAREAILLGQWSRQTVIFKNDTPVWTGTFEECIPRLAAFAEEDGIEIVPGGDVSPYSWTFVSR